MQKLVGSHRIISESQEVSKWRSELLYHISLQKGAKFTASPSRGQPVRASYYKLHAAKGNQDPFDLVNPFDPKSADSAKLVEWRAESSAPWEH